MNKKCTVTRNRFCRISVGSGNREILAGGVDMVSSVGSSTSLAALFYSREANKYGASYALNPQRAQAGQDTVSVSPEARRRADELAAVMEKSAQMTAALRGGAPGHTISWIDSEYQERNGQAYCLMDLTRESAELNPTAAHNSYVAEAAMETKKRFGDALTEDNLEARAFFESRLRENQQVYRGAAYSTGSGETVDINALLRADAPAQS